jgi:hypothetical protein
MVKNDFEGANTYKSGPVSVVYKDGFKTRKTRKDIKLSTKIAIGNPKGCIFFAFNEKESAVKKIKTSMPRKREIIWNSERKP